MTVAPIRSSSEVIIPEPLSPEEVARRVERRNARRRMLVHLLGSPERLQLHREEASRLQGNRDATFIFLLLQSAGYLAPYAPTLPEQIGAYVRQGWRPLSAAVYAPTIGDIWFCLDEDKRATEAGLVGKVATDRSWFQAVTAAATERRSVDAIHYLLHYG